MLRIVIDVMAQNKTKIPYFDRPDKCIASEQGLKTKLFAAIVHGFGVYLFWCTALIQTGSNLTIEVLWRTLNKIEAEQGFLRENIISPYERIISPYGKKWIVSPYVFDVDYFDL